MKTITRRAPQNTLQDTTRTIISDPRFVIVDVPSDLNDPVNLISVTTYFINSQGQTTSTGGLSGDELGSSSPEILAPDETLVAPTRSRATTFVPPSITAQETIAAPSATSTTSPQTSSTLSVTSATTQATSTSAGQPGSTANSTVAIALGVGGSFAALVIFGLIYYYVRRRLRRNKASSAATLPIAMQSLDTTKKSTRSPNITSPSTAEPILISDGPDDMARSTTLPLPGDRYGTDLEPRKRVPSRERQADQNTSLDSYQRAEAHDRWRPAPAWDGLRGLSNDDMRRMLEAPLSVTEDYSTNAGEGSVDGLWLETASLKEERLYRAQREGHSPPPPKPEDPELEPSPLRLNENLSPIHETDEGTRSAQGGSTGPEQSSNFGLPSPTEPQEDTSGQRDSGLGSGELLIKPSEN